eukprot:c18072_g1_i2.p1 GENE.c18072_g1_i2~~c18072_g1_i2.p1  ORF type:complete len:298 (-),score=101.48 c18072_g1_i2:59-952(-)
MLGICLPSLSVPEFLTPKIRASGIQLRWKQPEGVAVRRFGISYKVENWWSSITFYVPNTKESELSVLLSDVKPGEKVTVWIWAVGDYASSAYSKAVEITRPDDMLSAIYERNLDRCKAIFEENNRSPEFIVSCFDEDGVTCVHWAAWRGAVDILSWLLENGAKADSYADGMLPIHWACSHTKNEIVDEEHLWQCVVLLQRHTNCAFNLLTDKNRSILHLAIQSNLTLLATKILNIEANFMVPDNNGDYPVHWAAYQGNLTLIDLFCQRGVKIEIYDNQKQSPLHLAVISGDIRFVLK